MVRPNGPICAVRLLPSSVRSSIPSQHCGAVGGPEPKFQDGPSCVGRAVVLFGRFDLTIGMPVDTTAGRVIIDVKTGGFAPDHREDLRFYALIETLVTGVPPLMVATHYVDSGLLHEEAITEVVLDAAVRRTVVGIVRLCELRDDEVVPVRKPGPTCRWCPIADDCEPGQNWLGEADDL